jgi:PIN domain nuclease of toxin-antitoxin system
LRSRFVPASGRKQRARTIENEIAADDFIALPITLKHAQFAGLLPGRHRDPFDRMLAAQAQIEGLPLLTADRAFSDFGIQVLW